MDRRYYETDDDETNIYIEDDPNYDPNALPPTPVATSPAGMKLLLVDDKVLNYDDDDIISEIMDSYINTSTIEHGDDNHHHTTTTTIPPHEDPITDTNDKKHSHLKIIRVLSNEESDRAERKRRMSKIIQKWGICWMVVIVVGIAVAGTVIMFRRYHTTVKKISSSSTAQENNNGDVLLSSSPTSTPSMTPSRLPSFIPTMYPSVSPSVLKGDTDIDTTNNAPTGAPITTTPTAVPTSATPSNSPSTEQFSQIMALLRQVSTTPNQFNEITTYESQAAQWVKYNSTIDLISNEKMIQRYTMALLDLALHSKFTMALPSVDECEWLGVTCNTATTTGDTAANDMKDVTLYEPVVSIVWNDQNMTGAQIPNDIALLSESLMHLDLSGNPNLAGTIPSGLYSCTQLQYLYLSNTKMTGRIHSEIGQLTHLKKLFLGSSAFTGTIPTELGLSSLEWLSLYKNQFTGSLPTNLNWWNMTYLDLGRNQLIGTIPSDWINANSNTTSMMKLNALYLDHNMMNGTLPETLLALGDSTIELIVINDNLFTGEIPVNRDYPNYNLTTFQIQNNGFTRMDKEFCKQQSIYDGNGMLSILYTDCDICTCNDLCTTYCSQ